jgi:hypothetical protein
MGRLYCRNQQGTVAERLCGVALDAPLPVDLKCSEWIFAIESIGRKLLSINELLLPARYLALKTARVDMNLLVVSRRVGRARLNAPDSKSDIGVSLSGVRIPHSPPFILKCAESVTIPICVKQGISAWITAKIEDGWILWDEDQTLYQSCLLAADLYPSPNALRWSHEA